MSLFTGAAVIAAALAGSGATVFAASKSSGAAKKAGDQQVQANRDSLEADLKAKREALAYTQQKDAQDRADQLAVQRANYDQYVAREKRLAPYRASGEAANRTIAHLLGLPNVPIAAPPPMPSYLQDPNTIGPLLPR